jgi:hypothetical protein
MRRYRTKEEERGDIHTHRALRLHQLDRQPKQAPRLITHHLQIICLARTCQAVPPVQIHALSAMQIQQLFGEDIDQLGIVHGEQEGERAEVDVICGVDGLRGAED